MTEEIGFGRHNAQAVDRMQKAFMEPYLEATLAAVMWDMSEAGWKRAADWAICWRFAYWALGVKG